MNIEQPASNARSGFVRSPHNRKAWECGGGDTALERGCSFVDRFVFQRRTSSESGVALHLPPHSTTQARTRQFSAFQENHFMFKVRCLCGVAPAKTGSAFDVSFVHTLSCRVPMITAPNAFGAVPLSFGAEQNPQPPLASEDAFAQVPGNAGTAGNSKFKIKKEKMKMSCTTTFPQPGSERGAETPRCACAPAASPTQNAHPWHLPARGGEFSAPRTFNFTQAINAVTAQRLAEAVIELAVADYRELVRCGRIAGGQLQPFPRRRDWKRDLQGVRGVRRFYRSDFETQALIHFFKRGGGLDEWLLLAKVQISSVCIRKKLGINL